jgi:hypothetical protein
MILIVCSIGLSQSNEGYNPVIISNRLCFSIEESKELIKKAELYALHKSNIEKRKEKEIAQSNIIESQKELLKNRKRKSIIKLIITGAGSFILGIFITKI